MDSKVITAAIVDQAERLLAFRIDHATIAARLGIAERPAGSRPDWTPIIATTRCSETPGGVRPTAWFKAGGILPARAGSITSLNPEGG